MGEIVWSSNALADLNEIGEYISADSPKYAEITVSRLFSKVEILSKNSRIGRVVPEVNKETIRELLEGNYRIIYEISETCIFILTVHHSSRMLRNTASL